MNHYRRILAPVRLGTRGEATARRALALARSADARLLLVHVLDHHTGYESDHVPFLPPEQMLERTRRALEQRLGALARRLGGESRVDTRVLLGRPAEVLPDLARDWRADLIVLDGSDDYGLRQAPRRAGRLPHWDLLTLQAGAEQRPGGRLRTLLLTLAG